MGHKSKFMPQFINKKGMVAKMKKVMTVIMLTGSECNLSCGYCYVVASRRNIKQFPASTMDRLIKNCAVGFDSVKFCWHGGEPLLVGQEFFKEAIKEQKKITEKNGTEFHNSIQSNGLLLDNTWLDFLTENNFHIGLSLDAPSEINQKHRKFDVAELFQLFSEMKTRNLPIGLLCVVSNLNVNLGAEIFEFFKTLRVDSFGLLALKNVSLDEKPIMPTNQNLYELYAKIFDLWAFTPNQFSCIEPLDTMLRSVLGQLPRACSFVSSCLKRMITIDQEGNVVPCGSLVSEEFILGNIINEPLIKILAKQKAKALRKIRDRYIAENCRDCKYIAMCRGGCRADAFWHSGHYGGDFPFCEARKLTFTHIEKRMEGVVSKNGE